MRLRFLETKLVVVFLIKVNGLVISVLVVGEGGRAEFESHTSIFHEQYYISFTQSRKRLFHNIIVVRTSNNISGTYEPLIKALHLEFAFDLDLTMAF